MPAITKNNILYQCDKSGGFGTGNLITNTNQFVNPTGGDFHLQANAQARDAGSALASTYSKDPDGNVRGADGKWDLGMYEYTNTGVSWQWAEGSGQSPSLPRLENNCQLQTANCQLHNLLGQRVKNIQNTGIYLVVPDNAGFVKTLHVTP